MESVLIEIAKETGGKTRVGLVSHDQRKLFQSFQVRLIPAIFIIRDAEVKKSYEGLVSKEILMRDLKELGGLAAR